MIWYFPRMKKKVSNKQDIEMIAENNEAAKSTESVQFRPEISGQELTEDMQAPEKTEESAQTTDSDHAETEEKTGITGIKQIIRKPGEIPVFLLL